MGCLGLQVFPSEKTQLCRLKLNLSHQLCDALLFELKKASGYVTMCLFPLHRSELNPALCQLKKSLQLCDYVFNFPSTKPMSKKTSASSYATMCLFSSTKPMSTKKTSASSYAAMCLIFHHQAYVKKNLCLQLCDYVFNFPPPSLCQKKNLCLQLCDYVFIFPSTAAN